MSPSMNHPTSISIPPMPQLAVLENSAVRTRGRSGSIVKVEEVGEQSSEQILDRSAYPNMNANWVNAKGAWAIHWVLIAVGKLILDNLPGMTTQISWTMLSLSYFSLTYLMFHWVTGVPFDSELHGGAYDDLTMWEQIDDGAQYTPAKKWLLSVPIILFLASTHYTNYNPWTFAINLTALILISIVPKLPALHRQRLRFMTGGTPAGTPSGSRAPSRQNSRAPSRQNSRQVSPTRSIR